MRLYLLECGTCTLDWEVLIPHGGPPGQVTVPIPALLIQADEGTYLIDTGMPDEWIGRGGNMDGEEIYPHMTADDAIEQRLAAVGLRPQDLTCVINTHLHFDHAGGNAHFTEVPILLQDAELAAGRAGEIDFQGWDQPGLRYETIRGDYHVCAGLDLLLTPGHTPGHQSVLVTLGDEQRLLFTIDAVYTALNWHEDVLGAMSDTTAGQHSVERLRHEAAQPGTTVVFGHDPAQWATLRHPPDYYA
jgi:N-acyl homoserine lactone hydrolase